MRSLSAFLLLTTAALTLAQERCDAPSPSVFCNTTEILAYQSSECSRFHIFLSRGSDEPYPGRLGNLTSEICSSIGGSDHCTFENVQYPAKSTAWGVDEWCKSAAKGAANGQSQMKEYADKCPDSKLILLGFSQGGSVAQDILGGGGGHVFSCDQAVNPALDSNSAPGSNIVAAVTFGAVVRSHGQNFTVGEGVHYDGRRARTDSQLAALNTFSDRFLDYCHFGDPMCAVGSEPESVEAHLNYFLQHNEEVRDWVVRMAKAAGGSESDGQGKPSKPAGAVTSSSAGAAKSTARATTTSAAASVTTGSVGVAQAKQTGSATASTGAARSLYNEGGFLGAAGGLIVSLLQVV